MSCTRGLHPFVAKEFASQARLFSTADFARLLERCFATDRLLKSSKVGGELHLFNLVLDVCGGGAPRRSYGGRRHFAAPKKVASILAGLASALD